MLLLSTSSKEDQFVRTLCEICKHYVKTFVFVVTETKLLNDVTESLWFPHTSTTMIPKIRKVVLVLIEQDLNKTINKICTTVCKP